jgi:hypothetical protein
MMKIMIQFSFFIQVVANSEWPITGEHIAKARLKLELEVD